MELLQKFLAQEGLNIQEKDGLILFDYSKEISYSGNWNDVTLLARGFVFEKATGKVISRPFPKFFNYEEPYFQITQFPNIPKDEPFYITKKEDGSLGICSFYNGEWIIHTRGSFESEQAKWAKKWFDANVNTAYLLPTMTYLFEIIYPENRIVIDYKGKEGLVLLGAINREVGHELPYDALCTCAGFIGTDVVPQFNYSSLEELFEIRGKLTANEEGFVIYYPRLNIRFKLKGAEYCRIHRIVSNMTPLAFWESIDPVTRKIPESFLVHIPEEFRELSDKIKDVLEAALDEKYNALKSKLSGVPEWMGSKELSKEQEKERWFYLAEKFGKEAGYALGLVTGQESKVVKSLLKEIRPKANVLQGVDLRRVNRLLEDG